MTQSIIVRRATRNDRSQIAYCIANAFADEFSCLCKNQKIVAKAIERGIQTKRFFVATEPNNIVGVLAIADCNGRCILSDPKSYRKYFGFFKGMFASLLLKDEFVKALNYPKTVGYIESVGVLNGYQGNGIATILMKFAIQNSKYTDFELDVTNVNKAAISCYQKCGFKIFKSEKVKHPKQKGYNERLFMRYIQA